ncbi:MAG: response regulator [Bacteroidota bacterium]|nr:response regulator [Bacteroidota bacterium]
MVEYRQSMNGLKQSMVHKNPMNVGLVAKICHVSKKTVLNWIYKDALKAYTTYGGHYRIWPGDLREFMVKAGLDVHFNFVDERQTSFLIIDDETNYAFVLKEIICTEFPTANVMITDDGYEALLLIGEKKPHVVILDLKMPKIDGFQVLELLKNRKKDYSFKIVVNSGFIDTYARERLANSIADEIWEKGKSANEIRQELRALLNGVVVRQTVSSSI